ncbi:MAG TPA: TetR/AcrR family transcriptional regulator [Labilithrix sp.]|nr:TetR/AcrR family transcriptional regulator [Labilithrix sp.]
MARPPRTERRATRDRIVDSAIALFNEQGVSAVTTNHIAEHAEISPGNLYYHFANKEEILREAFERVNDAADAIWTAPSAPASPRRADVGTFHEMLIGNLELFAKFAFLARELPALLRADPIMRARYTEIAARRMRELEELLRPFVKAGLLRDLDDPEDLRALVETAWVLGLFCIPYSETLDTAAPARTAKARAARLHDAIERGALLVLHLLRPYLDPLAYAGLVVLVRSQFEALAD